MGTHHVVGLDFGPPQEATAPAVVERTLPADPEDHAGVSTYAVRHLRRFPPGTPFNEIVNAVEALFAAPPVKGGQLVLDLTAVGKPVLDLFRRSPAGLSLLPLTVTAGHDAACEHGTWQVPRRVLVSTLQVVLQSRRLQVASQLPEAAVLVEELTKFKWKPPTLNMETLEVWREGPHDDLVLAVAIAVWQAERNWHLWVVRFIG